MAHPTRRPTTAPIIAPGTAPIPKAPEPTIAPSPAPIATAASMPPPPNPTLMLASLSDNFVLRPRSVAPPPGGGAALPDWCFADARAVDSVHILAPYFKIVCICILSCLY
jgi:hypothetical protein